MKNLGGALKNLTLKKYRPLLNNILNSSHFSINSSDFIIGLIRIKCFHRNSVWISMKKHF